jgi:hypothetical protein
MISGRLFVLKSKMNTTYLFWFNKSFNASALWFTHWLWLFSYPASNKNTDIKVGGLITTLIYLFSIYGSLKLFYKHFLKN